MGGRTPEILPGGPACLTWKPPLLTCRLSAFLQVCQYNQNVVSNQSNLAKLLQFTCPLANLASVA
jgi:hypothetical protein